MTHKDVTYEWVWGPEHGDTEEVKKYQYHWNIVVSAVNFWRLPAACA